MATADDGGGEIADGDGLVAADIEDLAGGGGCLHEREDGRDDIGDVGEAAELVTVVVNDEGLAGESRIDEAGEDHAVGTGLAGADDVEKAADDDGQAELAGAGEGEEFVDGFAGTVGPAGARGGAENEVVLFGPGFFGVLAIHFAGAGEEEFYLLAGAVAAAEVVEQELRGIDVALDRLERLAGDEGDADGGGEVIDFGNVIESRFDGGGVADGAALKLEARMIRNGGEILEATGGFVVDDGDVIAASEECFGEVGADEAGTASDEDICHKNRLNARKKTTNDTNYITERSCNQRMLTGANGGNGE